MHAKNFIHRDIKPDNFVMGLGLTASTVYLIDFGMTKRYRDATTKMHIPYKNCKKLTGTARYASLNSHMGIVQSRRDDLECLAHTLVYLAKGGLPWQGIRADNKQEKYQKILERKKAISVDLLCKGLPAEFANMFYYCRSLKFEDKPDYMMLKKRFTDLFYSSKFNHGFDYDWNLLKINMDEALDRESSGEETDQQQEQEQEQPQPSRSPEQHKPQPDLSAPKPAPPREEQKRLPPSKRQNNRIRNEILMRQSSAPQKLRAPFLKVKELPPCFISKRIKEIRQDFLRQNNADCCDGISILPHKT